MKKNGAVIALNGHADTLEHLTHLQAVDTPMRPDAFVLSPDQKVERIAQHFKAIMETLPPGERASDSMRITFVLKKGSDTVHVDAKGYAAWAEKGYEYSDRLEEIIAKGYQWPIHDFSIIDIEKGLDKTDEFLHHQGYQWVFIATFLESAYQPAFESVKALAQMSVSKGQPFYALSSTSSDIADEFARDHELGFSFHSTDQKTLMTMARYNPTLYLFKGPVVVKKWSGRHLPSVSVFDSKLLRP